MKACSGLVLTNQYYLIIKAGFWVFYIVGMSCDVPTLTTIVVYDKIFKQAAGPGVLQIFNTYAVKHKLYWILINAHPI